MNIANDIKLRIARLTAKVAIIVATIVALPEAHAADFKATLDSAYLLMGKTTPVRFTIVVNGNADGKVVMVADSLPSEIELIPCDDPVSERETLSGSRTKLTGQFMIQSFDSGDYRIPPLIYVNGTDTLTSNSLNLKVIPVETQEDQDIFAESDPLDAGKAMLDWLPSWWYWALIGVLVIAAGVLAYLIMSKKIVIKLPAKKPEPPYQVARRQLDAIRQEHLWDQSQEKHYYTRLTDILRTYLHGRFGINAMELTSSQILAELRVFNLPSDEIARISELLSTADFVKFAKMKPSREEDIACFQYADDFVEATKPVSVDEGTDSEPYVEPTDSHSSDKV